LVGELIDGLLEAVDLNLDVDSAFDLNEAGNIFVYESLKYTLGLLFSRLENNSLTTLNASSDNISLSNEHLVKIFVSSLEHDGGLSVGGNLERSELRSDLAASLLKGFHLALSFGERHISFREGGDADRLGHLLWDVR
jgi:hypothetical protein